MVKTMYMAMLFCKWEDIFNESIETRWTDSTFSTKPHVDKMVYVHGNLYDLTLVNTMVAYFTDFHNKLTEAVSWAAL